MWTGIIAWRCALILLQNDGLKLHHLSAILAGRPPWKWPQGLEWLVALVLLLIFPQSLIEPLFSGSINWNSAVDYAPSIQVPSGYETSTASWYWYLNQEVDRKTAVRTAGGMASVSWSVGDSQQSKDGTVARLGGNACRHVLPTALTTNSTVLDATIPCIQIQNITWAGGPVPQDIRDIAYTYDSNRSVIGDPPFVYSHSGVAALFSPEDLDWHTYAEVIQDKQTATAAYPAATKYSGSMTVLLYLSRPSNKGETDCKPVLNSTFGSSSYLTNQLKNSFSGAGYNDSDICLTWGTVYFTAGVIKAPQSTFVSAQVVEYNPATTMPSEADISAAIEPSIWTREALWLMPDIMTEIAVMNTSLLPTWENVDNYTATLIRYAYFAGWDVLHASFEQTDTALLTASPAEQRLEASVSFPRLFAWFGMTLFVPLTGLILKYLHERHSSRSMITETAVMLFNDPSIVIAKYPNLTGMAGITEEDKKMGKIVLQQVEPEQPRFRLILAEN